MEKARREKSWKIFGGSVRLDSNLNICFLSVDAKVHLQRENKQALALCLQTSWKGAVIKGYSWAPSVIDSLSSLICSFDAGDSHKSTLYDGRTTIFLFCHPVPFWWSQPSPRSGWNHIIWQYRFFSSPRCNKLHHIFHPMYRDNVHCLRCPFRFPRVWSQKTISRATVSDHYCLHAVPALSVKHVVGLEKKRIYCLCSIKSSLEEAIQSAK